MNFTKELIQAIRELPLTPEMSSLLNDLEEFMAIHELFAADPNNTELEQKWHEMRDKIWSSFEKTTESLGITPEAIEEYVSNPNNFSKETWENLERVQNQISDSQLLKDTKG